jgi:hypothetical protein
MVRGGGLKKYSRILFVAWVVFFTHATFFFCDAFAEPSDAPDENQQIFIPLSADELKKLPQEKIPQELREELKAVPPADVLVGSKNTKFDYLLMISRGMLNGTSIAAGFIINMGASLGQAVVPGVTGMAMSSTLQFVHPWKSHWLKHKSQPKTWYDIKGYFTVSETEKASFVESFFIKEFSVGIFYLNAVQVVSALSGIQPDYFSWRPFASAAMGLFSEGVWNVLIAHVTEKLVEKNPLKGKMIWRLSKLSATGVSVLSTFSSVMFMMQKPWAPMIAVGMGVSGALVFATLSAPAQKFFGGCAQILKLFPKKS